MGRQAGYTRVPQEGFAAGGRPAALAPENGSRLFGWGKLGSARERVQATRAAVQVAESS